MPISNIWKWVSLVPIRYLVLSLVLPGGAPNATADPVLIAPHPSPGTRDVSPRIPIEFTIVDGGEGVQTALFLNGLAVSRGQAIRNGDQVDYSYRPDPDRQFAINDVRVEFTSLVGTGTIFTNAWSFMTTVDPNFIGPRAEIRSDSGALVVTWPLDSFLLGYVLETANSASDLAWNPVPEAVTNRVVITVDVGAQFFRLNSYPPMAPGP